MKKFKRSNHFHEGLAFEGELEFKVSLSSGVLVMLIDVLIVVLKLVLNTSSM